MRNMKDETVWLSREQMAKLFDVDRTGVSRHIKNIFDEELTKEETVANFATVQQEGNKTVERNIEYYNLDVIISVGYRVKSKNGIVFRKWANGILKDYMLKGYVINNKRLKFLEKKIKLIDIAGRIGENSNNSDVLEIIKVINNYKDALDLLDAYDHKTVVKP